MAGVQRRSSRPSASKGLNLQEDPDGSQAEEGGSHPVAHSQEAASAMGPAGNNSQADAANQQQEVGKTESIFEEDEAHQLLASRPDVWQPALEQYRTALRQSYTSAEQTLDQTERHQQSNLAQKITLKFGRALDRGLDWDQRAKEEINKLEWKDRKREAAKEGWRKRKASSGGKQKRRKLDNISSDEEGTWSSQPGRSLKPTQGGAAGAGLNASTGNEVAELLDDLKHKDPLERQDALWSLIARKEVPQAHKQLTQFTTSRSSYIKRYSGLVAREGKRVMTGTTANGGRTRPIKELQVKSKKIARELIVHMKGSEKREKDIKKAAAKREQERVKQEEEMKDAKRQARKLNFLLEQTELYGHFIGSKIRNTAADDDDETAAAEGPEPTTAADGHPVADSADGPQPAAAARALDLDQVAATDQALEPFDFEDENEENLHEHAKLKAAEAHRKARARAEEFDRAAKLGEEAAENGDPMDIDSLNFQNPTDGQDVAAEVVKQPDMLNCSLKSYQLKGLSWMANLYEQGINGILADEMGLGKTVQSISLLAYLAEKHDIWGPFLVVAPASTLHNWQQEITRFVPSLKALPYWGSIKDRTTLRKFWNKKYQRYDKDAPFHVLVTSYQIVVADEKYFQRVKWQYMILDEAQAIKSSGSARWKALLNLNCRNRLLLTGTPIQNSMQELWALLHFIMPQLFQSSDEFSDWFSKDIEGSAGLDKGKNGGGGGMNELQLKRLHMVLKPFMLRRVKKNVQNELGDKVEIDVRCDLTPRQRVMYATLRENIPITDLIARASSLGGDEAAVKRLMNLIMQFRKVCNHPELFERADVKAPLSFSSFNGSINLIKEAEMLDVPYATSSWIQLHAPKLLEDENLLHLGEPDIETHHLHKLCNIWSAKEIAQSGLLGWSPAEVHRLARGSCLEQLSLEIDREQRKHVWQANESERRPMLDISNALRLPGLTDVSSSYAKSLVLPKGDRQVFTPKAVAVPPEFVMSSRHQAYQQKDERFDANVRHLFYGLPPKSRDTLQSCDRLSKQLPGLPPNGVLESMRPDEVPRNNMRVPQLHKLILDSGKLAKLDKLLAELKANGHRVLVYFQMTRMIDLMEEYLSFRQYKYLRLDGSSTISERRDMVSDWQTRPDLFIFLLSTRAGGVGINLTSADTVIFYDCDWNPANDAQAMDRCHRIGQTKQVTIYRLITAGTIDERILQLARSKQLVQNAVVGSSTTTVDTSAKPAEVMSLLLDDDEMRETVRKQQVKRQMVGELKSEGARKGLASRQENKRVRELALQGTGTSTPIGDSADEDDALAFFSAGPTNENEDEDNAPVETEGDDSTTTGAKRKGAPKARAPQATAASNGSAGVGDSGDGPPKQKRKRRTKAELEELDRLGIPRRNQKKKTATASADGMP